MCAMTNFASQFTVTYVAHQEAFVLHWRIATKFGKKTSPGRGLDNEPLTGEMMRHLSSVTGHLQMTKGK